MSWSDWLIGAAVVIVLLAAFEELFSDIKNRSW